MRTKANFSLKESNPNEPRLQHSSQVCPFKKLETQVEVKHEMFWIFLRFWIKISFFNIFWQKKIEKKNFQNFIPIPWEWPTECFKPHCGHDLLTSLYLPVLGSKSSGRVFRHLHAFTIIHSDVCEHLQKRQAFDTQSQTYQKNPKNKFLESS